MKNETRKKQTAGHTSRVLLCMVPFPGHLWRNIFGTNALTRALVLQVSRAVEFSHRRLDKVLPVHLALKQMRRLDCQGDLIDEISRPSVDAFVYALQKKGTQAAAQGLVPWEQAGDFVCAYLEETGWTLTPEFRDAVGVVFGSKR
jgi:hypothetical protein